MHSFSFSFLYRIAPLGRLVFIFFLDSSPFLVCVFSLKGLRRASLINTTASGPNTSQPISSNVFRRFCFSASDDFDGGLGGVEDDGLGSVDDDEDDAGGVGKVDDEDNGGVEADGLGSVDDDDDGVGNIDDEPDDEDNGDVDDDDGVDGVCVGDDGVGGIDDEDDDRPHSSDRKNLYGILHGECGTDK